MHFSLSRSGILSLDRADAVIEITEWVEVPRKNLTIENSTISSNTSNESGAGDSSESNENLETDSGVNKTSDISAEEQIDSGANKTPNVSAEEQAVAEPATERKLKKRTFRVPLKVKSGWPLLFRSHINWRVIIRKKNIGPRSCNYLMLSFSSPFFLLVAD